jgi:hypothetical protein
MRALRTEPKEKHGVWDPMPELAATSPYVHSRVDSQNIYHGQPYATVEMNPMPVSTLSPSQGLWIWPLGPFQDRCFFKKMYLYSTCSDYFIFQRS